jgi:hypothetical protein
MTDSDDSLPPFNDVDCVAVMARIVSEHARWHLEHVRGLVTAAGAYEVGGAARAGQPPRQRTRSGELERNAG